MSKVTEMPRKDVPPPLELVKSRIEEVLPPDAKALVDAGEVAVIDTREPDRFEAGHLDGAVNVPAGENGVGAHSADYAARITEAAAEKPALLYCNSGNRSARATDALGNEHSLEGVRSMVGGITLWNDLGYPVAGVVLSDDEQDQEDEADDDD